MALAVVRNEFYDVRSKFQTMLQVPSYMLTLAFALHFFFTTGTDKYHTKR
jgi:hypothetical protein